MSHHELACVCAALILQNDDVPVTDKKIDTILKAARVEVEPFWPGLFAKALQGIDVKTLITSISSGVGAGPAPGAAAAPAAGGAAAPAAEEAPAKEEKKEEPKKESDDDMGFGLFD